MKYFSVRLGRRDRYFWKTPKLELSSREQLLGDPVVAHRGNHRGFPASREGQFPAQGKAVEDRTPILSVTADLLGDSGRVGVRAFLQRAAPKRGEHYRVVEELLEGLWLRHELHGGAFVGERDDRREVLVPEGVAESRIEEDRLHETACVRRAQCFR